MDLHRLVFGPLLGPTYAHLTITEIHQILGLGPKNTPFQFNYTLALELHIRDNVEFLRQFAISEGYTEGEHLLRHLSDQAS